MAKLFCLVDKKNERIKNYVGINLLSYIYDIIFFYIVYKKKKTFNVKNKNQLNIWVIIHLSFLSFHNETPK